MYLASLHKCDVIGDFEKFAPQPGDLENKHYHEVIIKTIGETEDCLKIDKCHIDNLYIFGRDLQINNLNINSSLIETLKLESISVRGANNLEINIKDSKIKSIELIDTKIKCLKVTRRSTIDFIRFYNSSTTEEVNFKDSVIGILQMETMCSAKLDDAQIDKVVVEQSNIDKALKDIRDIEATYKNQSSAKISALQDYLIVLNAIVRSLEERKKYVDLDKYFVLVRKVNFKISHYQAKSNYIKKGDSNHRRTLWKTAYLICGKIEDISRFLKYIMLTCFGWGIKLKSNLLLLSFIIIAYSLYYSHTLFADMPLSNRIISSIVASIVCFFNVETELFIRNSYVCLSESVLGIISLTIITGVIVRKIIR